MVKYRDVFPKKKTLLPVIHTTNAEQVLRNVEIAEAGGADGVFLIHMDGNAIALARFYLQVRMEFPSAWVGINILGEDDNREVIAMAADLQPDGLWIDFAGYDDTAVNPVEEVSKLRDWQSYFKLSNTLIFGGVAFKGNPKKVEDPAKAALLTAPLLDVVTTSGPGTGMAADVHKIRAMKNAMGVCPLAIASGVTPDNVSDYIDSIDCFLVATGINESFYELNPDKVKLLAQKLAG